jgi:predicted amidohydrolase
MLLFALDEANGIRKAAPNAQVVDIGEFRVGLAICSDANSRWLQRQYREAKVDAVLYSVTSAVPAVARWRRYWPVARRYDAWLLAANRGGAEGRQTYPGTAFIAAPNCAMQELWKGGEGYVTAVIGRD